MVIEGKLHSLVFRDPRIEAGERDTGFHHVAVGIAHSSLCVQQGACLGPDARSSLSTHILEVLGESCDVVEV